MTSSYVADLFACLGRKTTPVGIRNVSPDDSKAMPCKVNIVGRPGIPQEWRPAPECPPPCIPLLNHTFATSWYSPLGMSIYRGGG